MKYIAKFTDHLEFLGYKIEDPEGKTDSEFDLALALHTQDNNLLLVADKALEMLHLQVRLNFNKKVSGIMYEYLDEVNGALNISRAYIDEDESSLMLQTHWTGQYEKKLFGEFLQIFKRDQQILVSFPDFEKIWT